MSGGPEDLSKHASWFRNQGQGQDQDQDQVPSVDLDDRTTNKWYPWEGVQPGQTNPQQAILDPPHSLGQNVVTGLGQGFMGTGHPAPYDEVGNQYMSTVQTSHAANYSAGGNEKNQYYGYDPMDQEHVDPKTKATAEYNVEAGGTYPVQSAVHGFGAAQGALAPLSAAPHPSPSPDGVFRDSISRSQSQSGRTVTCLSCGATVSGKHASGNFTRHQKSMKCPSSDRKKKWYCSNCDKVYRRSDALRKHERNVHRPSPDHIEENL